MNRVLAAEVSSRNLGPFLLRSSVDCSVLLSVVCDSRGLRARHHYQNVRSEASVIMQRLSYLTETVLSNKIAKNTIVLSFKDSPRKPFGSQPPHYAEYVWGRRPPPFLPSFLPFFPSVLNVLIHIAEHLKVHKWDMNWGVCQAGGPLVPPSLPSCCLSGEGTYGSLNGHKGCEMGGKSKVRSGGGIGGSSSKVSEISRYCMGPRRRLHI